MNENLYSQARDRQQLMQAQAADHQDLRRLRRVSRAARRAERAERQLSRSWHEATRRRAELSEVSEGALL
jgi:IS5 family transposase